MFNVVAEELLWETCKVYKIIQLVRSVKNLPNSMGADKIRLLGGYEAINVWAYYLESSIAKRFCNVLVEWRMRMFSIVAHNPGAKCDGLICQLVRNLTSSPMSGDIYHLRRRALCITQRNFAFAESKNQEQKSKKCICSRGIAFRMVGKVYQSL